MSPETWSAGTLMAFGYSMMGLLVGLHLWSRRKLRLQAQVQAVKDRLRYGNKIQHLFMPSSTDADKCAHPANDLTWTSLGTLVCLQPRAAHVQPDHYTVDVELNDNTRMRFKTTMPLNVGDFVEASGVGGIQPANLIGNQKVIGVVVGVECELTRVVTR